MIASTKFNPINLKKIRLEMGDIWPWDMNDNLNYQWVAI